MAFTSTSSHTFARLVLLTIQLRAVLRRTTSINKDQLDRLMTVVEKKWIKTIYVYAEDNQNLCHGLLQLDIDWSIFEEQSKYSSTVSISEQYSQGLLPEIEEASDNFIKFINTYSFRTHLKVSLRQSVYNDSSLKNEVYTSIGLMPRSKVREIEWAGSQVRQSLNIYELPELKINFNIVDKIDTPKKNLKSLTWNQINPAIE